MKLRKQQGKTSCKDKSVDGIKLNKAIGTGCLIVQTSSDGVEYETVGSICNLLSDYSTGIGNIYELSPEEVLSGTFFKVIIAYQTHKKIGESSFLFVHNDNYDNRYHVEVYDFYIGFDKPSVALKSIVVKENNVGIIPVLYENSKNFHYEGNVTSNKMAFGKKSLGEYSIVGQFTNINSQSDVTDIVSASREFLINYKYGGSLDSDDSGWELSADTEKKIDDIELETQMGAGAIVFQHSVDGKSWTTDHVITDAFKNTLSDWSYSYYVDEDMENGAFYRTIVAYQTRRKTETSKVLFISKENYEYLKQVEVYTVHVGIDANTKSSDIWDDDSVSHICGFTIDKMGTRYDVTVNGAMAEDRQKYVTNGEYTVVVSTPLGKTDSRTIVVDRGYDSLSEMIEETEDLTLLDAFDLDNGMELENGGVTENGFRLDFANSHYLMVIVKREKIVDGLNGLTLNTSFNGIVKDGMSFNEPGIYTITAIIPSTGHRTEKIIYVGDKEDYEEFLSQGKEADEEER